MLMVEHFPGVDVSAVDCRLRGSMERLARMGYRGKVEYASERMRRVACNSPAESIATAAFLSSICSQSWPSLRFRRKIGRGPLGREPRHRFHLFRRSNCVRERFLRRRWSIAAPAAQMGADQEAQSSSCHFRHSMCPSRKRQVHRIR